jgi:mono/diheme cytochrome c family protein
LALVLSALIATMLAAAEQPVIKRVTARTIDSVAGVDLFREYCAVCHGSDARGAGPAAAALKPAPKDLTQISRRHNGKFPELHVQRVINGEDVVVAHGTRDMPIWGQLLRSTSSTKDVATIKVYNLVKYLEEIQAK